MVDRLLQNRFKLELSEETWREGFLRVSGIAMLVGCVLSGLIHVTLIGYLQTLPAYLLGTIASGGTLVLLDKRRYETALWFFLILGSLAIGFLAILSDSPQSPFVITAAVAAAVLIGLIGRPIHIFLSISFAIFFNLLSTYLYTEGIRPSAIDVSWGDSLTAVIMYAALLPPITVASFILNYVLDESRQSNHLLQEEVQRRIVSERKFRDLYNSIPVMSHTGEFGTGILIEVNDFWLQKLGYERKEVLGRAITDFMTSESREHLFKKVLTHLQTSRNIDNVSATMIKKDGTLLKTISSATIHQDEAGNPEYIVTTMLDVTELKEAHQEIQQQNQWFRNVIDTIPDSYLVFDETGCLVDINKTGIENLGYTRDEMIGMSISDIDIDWDTKKLQETSDQFLATTGQIVTGRHKTKDGTVFPVEIAGTTLMQGEHLRRVGFARDVRERIASEDALRANEEKFRSIYNTTPAGMYLVDHQDRLVDVNDRWLEMIGYSREELLGRQSVEFLAPASQKQAIKVDIPQLLQRGYARDIPYQIIHKDGHTFDVLFNATTRTDDKGDFVGGLATIIDVTERNQLANEIAKSETRFRTIFNTVNVGIYLTDTTGTLIDINDRWVEILGYTKEEMIGKKAMEFVTPESRDYVKKVANPFFFEQGGYVENIPNKFLKKNGEIIDVLVTARRRFDEDNNPLGRLVSLVDVTERNRLQQNILQGEQRYQDLYNQSPIMLHSVDGNGMVIDVNEYWLSSMGNTREEVIDSPVGQYFTEASMKKAMEIDMPTYFHLGYANDLQYQMVKKSGEIIDVLFSTLNLLDEEGNFTHTQATIKDVTKEKQLTAQLIAQERQVRVIFDNAFHMVGLLETDGTLVAINDASLALSNVTREVVIGKKFWDDVGLIRTPEMKDQMREATKRAAQGEFVRFELVIPTDNMTHAIDFSLKPMIDEDGNVIQLISEGRDITELKEAGRLIRQSEQKFKALFNDSSDFTVAMSAEGVILDINDKIIFLGTRTREEIVGRYLWDSAFFIKTLQVPNNLRSMWEAVTQHKKSVRKEMSFENPTFGTISVDVILNPIFDVDEQIDMMILEARDITQLVSTREALRQSVSDKEILLREVHHRVKNNLQIITSMLRLEERVTSDPQMRSNLLDLRNRVKSMALIHRQLYQRDSELSEIALDIYTHKLLQEISRTYSNKVELQVDVSAIKLDIDSALTSGLIINELVNNAHKYAFEDGHGTIFVEAYEVNETIELIVADDGVGLPEFVDLENVETTGFRLISLMVKQLTGKLEINSDNGTRIKIVFPKKRF